jgi:hypothetical protein
MAIHYTHFLIFTNKQLIEDYNHTFTAILGIFRL